MITGAMAAPCYTGGQCIPESMQCEHVASEAALAAHVYRHMIARLQLRMRCQYTGLAEHN